MNDLPQMHWCEECGQDVDVTEAGCCIHCGDQVWTPPEQFTETNDDAKAKP